MPYCLHCGVELDSGSKECPLCGTLLPHLDTKPVIFEDYPEREHRLHHPRRHFTNRERLGALNFTALIILIPFTSLLSTDLLINGQISWSVFPLTTFISVMAIVACSLFIRNPWLLLGSFLVNAVITSLILHLASGTLELFFRWALPIAVTAALVIMTAIIYGVKTRSRGFNIAGAALWAVAVFCLLLDGIISFNTGSGRIIQGWSIITGSVLFPLGSLFLYIHYRFGGRISLSRYFTA
jgi:hypothetical protein